MIASNTRIYFDSRPGVDSSIRQPQPFDVKCKRFVICDIPVNDAPREGHHNSQLLCRQFIRRHHRQWAIYALVCVFAILFGQRPSMAQPTQQELFTTPTEPPIAIPGNPFGVASMWVPVGMVDAGRLPRIVITQAENRVHYPAIDLIELAPPSPESIPNNVRRIGQGGLVDRLRHAINNAQQQANPPKALRIQFLFRGDQPFQIDLVGDINQTLTVSPDRRAVATHRSSILQWWEGYTQQAKRQLAAGDYPPGIETYLVEMLANRLELPSVDLRTKHQIQSASKNEPLSTLELLGGTDAMRADIMRAAMIPPAKDSDKTAPLPSPPTWIELAVPPVPETVAIEPIAFVVPPECFYMRFGSFSNYLWFQRLTQGQGGGIAQSLMMRGIDYEANRRVERMLNTKTTLVAKLFGDSIIEDMSLIGTDLYMQDGPALGAIFQAKNLDLLLSSLNSERQATAERLKNENVRLESFEILGQSVSLLSSPDNRIRSFLVQQDKYVLITTSKYICQRFIEVTQGKPSMAQSPTFRYTRLVMPLQNQYDVFAFFSPEFFRNLVSPQYQIELRRRLQAIAHAQIADMASLAAKSEQKQADSLEQIIAHRLLPSWFLAPPDGSRPVQTKDRWIDARRGARGSFLPIPDVAIESCSPEEVDRYATNATFYTGSWQQTDPLVVGIRKFAEPGKKDIEKLAIEAYVAPFGRDKYGWLSQFLAPPITTQIQLPPDDIINIQTHLSGQSILNRYPIPDHVLFVGVKDMIPPLPENSKGLIATLRMLQMTPAYLGAWPLPGYLDRLPLGLGGGPSDALGFSRLLIGAWRWQAGGFSVLSFDRTILENAMMHLKPVPAEDPAQVRLQVGDIEGSKLSNWCNTYWYRRGLTASRGNALLLDAIQTQFQVSPEDAKKVAERFLDGKVQCPLGGSFVLSPEDISPFNPSTNTSSTLPRSNRLWYSTAWPVINEANRNTPPNRNPSVSNTPPQTKRTALMGLDTNPDVTLPPPDYHAPWIGWFRGGRAHLTQMPNQLVFLAQMNLQKLPPLPDEPADPSSAIPLPNMNFDLFNAPFQFFGAGKSQGPKEGENQPANAEKTDPGKTKPDKNKPQTERREFE